MKIIKSFRTEYDCRTNPNAVYPFYFGLGDDGRLYYTHYNPKTNKFFEWKDYDNNDVGYKICFAEAIEIAKQFGHLLIFT